MKKVRDAAPGTASATAKRGRKRLSNPDYRALADFRFTLRKFLVFSESAAKQAGLTPQQQQALLTIKGAPDLAAVNVSLLSARLLIHHSTAVELVNRLERRGLVERAPDRRDGRRTRLVVTSEAERLLLSLSTAHLRELKELQPSLVKLIGQLTGRG